MLCGHIFMSYKVKIETNDCFLSWWISCVQTGSLNFCDVKTKCSFSQDWLKFKIVSFCWIIKQKIQLFLVGTVAFLIYFTRKFGEVKPIIKLGENRFSHLFLCWRFGSIRFGNQTRSNERGSYLRVRNQTRSAQTMANKMAGGVSLKWVLTSLFHSLSGVFGH